MACRAQIRGDCGWRSSVIVRFRSATRASCSSSARPGDAPQRRAQPPCAAVGSRPEFRAERISAGCSPTPTSSPARPPTIGAITPTTLRALATTRSAAGPSDRRQLDCRRRRGDAGPAGRFRPLGQARDRGLVVGRSARSLRNSTRLLTLPGQNGFWTCPSGESRRFRQLEPVIRRTFDIPTMVRLSVGPSRANLTEARPRGHGKEGQRRFVHDSPLEEAGFEPSVPGRGRRFRFCRRGSGEGSQRRQEAVPRR